MGGRLLKKLKFVLVKSLILIFTCNYLISCNYRPRSGNNRNKIAITSEKPTEEKEERVYREERHSNTTTSIPLEKDDGVYYIRVKVNDVPMRFVFDTGASFISMSLTEAQFLIKQGTINEDDLIGTINISDANGGITEAYVVNLRTIQLGDYILRNVEASIIPNQIAPLLLGQTALKQFGTIKIDNQNQKLILEN